MIKKKKDVLFLCQFFYPEYNSSATLPWDTAKYLAHSGLTVGAMCGYPREYNNSEVMLLSEIKEKVLIKRLNYLQLKRGKKAARLINYFSFTMSVLRHICEVKKYKCVMVYSNPPILPVAAIIANRLYKTKIVFVSYDVYPEVAYASGSLQADGSIAKVMRYLNRKLFSRVSATVALTDEMRTFLITHRPELCADRVKVIPNWAHESKYPKMLQTYEKFGYSEEDFIVSYFGNMGICQDMETMLQTMEILKNHDHIKFFLLGHGRKMDEVIERTRNYPNVQILYFLTGIEFEQAVSISSCGIVSLERGLHGTCAPSKYYSYLQGGIPVISVTELDSYLAQEIIQKKVGKAVAIGDGNGLARIIKELASNQNLCLKMGKRAEDLYKEKYEKVKCLKQYREVLRKVIGESSEE